MDSLNPLLATPMGINRLRWIASFNYERRSTVVVMLVDGGGAQSMMKRSRMVGTGSSRRIVSSFLQ